MYTGNYIWKNTGIIASHNGPSSYQFEVYEVFRVAAAKPLFWQDHIQRLITSAKQASLPIQINENVLLQGVKELIEANKLSVGNIRLSIASENLGELQLIAGFIPHRYPTESELQNGVSVNFFEFERPNPTIKQGNIPFKTTVQNYLKRTNTFEALLINKQNTVTEGSRSNVFALKGNTLYTSPSTKVLQGITRKKIIECLHSTSLTLSEQLLPPEAYLNADALFLSGTSIDVLPIKNLEQATFHLPNANIVLLQNLYNQQITRDLVQFKWNAVR